MFEHRSSTPHRSSAEDIWSLIAISKSACYQLFNHNEYPPKKKCFQAAIDDIYIHISRFTTLSISGLHRKLKCMRLIGSPWVLAEHHSRKEPSILTVFCGQKCTLCLFHTAMDTSSFIDIYWLVDLNPLKNMKVNWDDYSQFMENNPNVPHHPLVYT